MQQKPEKQDILLKLIELGYLDSNIRFWNRQAYAALDSFNSDNLSKNINNIHPSQITTNNLFTQNIINEMKRQGFYLSRGLNRNNIVYIRNCNPNGNSNTTKNYNYADLRVLLTIEHTGKAFLKGCWKCTIDASERAIRNNKLDNELYKISVPQQTWAWIIGTNSVEDISQEGLVQIRPIAVHRLNSAKELISDFKNLGINQNGGSPGSIGKFYADSLTSEGHQPHHSFINILKTDDRYLVNNNYIFASAFLDGYHCSVIN